MRKSGGTFSNPRASISLGADCRVNSDATSDARLVEAALAGDDNAFGDLVTRYQDRLFNTLVHCLGSPDDAEDAVQDALLQAYAKLASFRGASQFYTWLYRIAMNVGLTQLRRRKPVASLDHAKEALGEEPPAADDGPEQRLLADERVAHVQAALADLGDQHRQILVLREIEGFSYEEIAEVLDLPVGTVRSRLFRARGQIKDRLAPTWDESPSMESHETE